MASINGYGSTGPYADRPSFDFIAQAMSGYMSVNGGEGSEPLRLAPIRNPDARATLEVPADPSAAGLDFGEIELPPGTVVNGTVFGADGSRATDAALFVCRESYWTEVGRIVRLDQAAPIGRASDDGTFLLDERLVPNRPAPLLLAASDRGIGFTDLEDLQRGDATIRVEVRMLPSAPVRVRAASGALRTSVGRLCSKTDFRRRGS